MSGEVWILVPLAAMGLVFGVFWVITRYLMQKAAAQAGADPQYRQLAGQAVAGQRELLEAMQQIARSLQEVEKLLREV